MSVAALPAVAQTGDGRARCIRAAVCDAAGAPAVRFEQGEAAHFHFDFLVLRYIEVVSGGVEIHEATGRVVHGKDAFQRETPVPGLAPAGCVLRYHAVVKLDLAYGDYVFSVGLAAVDASTHARYRAGELSYYELSRAIQEVVRARGTGGFTVVARADGRLTHHGLADLPGSLELLVDRAPTEALPAAPARAPRQDRPTVYHLTHWKAGSQWIKQILIDCVPELVVEPQVGEVQYRNWPIQPGRVYPTLYLDKREFEARAQPGPARRFVVVRDLRDTLVSAYFSFKISHGEIDPAVTRLRAALASASEEDGLIYLMDEWLPGCARIQLSWAESGERLIRYEDLIERDLEILEPLLLGECALPVPRERLRAAIIANRFASQTGGRQPGVEDRNAHQRKGVSGDWRGHFTRRVKQAFKARFGGILVATGYERDLDW